MDDGAAAQGSELLLTLLDDVQLLVRTLKANLRLRRILRIPSPYSRHLRPGCVVGSSPLLISGASSLRYTNKDPPLA
jgi:hypothetical protein